MQSASLNGRLQLGPARMWDSARASMQGGLWWSALLVLLLTFAVARSTATAGWVNGIDIIPLIALAGAFFMAVLAVLPVPWPFALGAGMILGPVVAFIQAWPEMHALHRTDVLNQNLIGIWWGRILDGSAALDTSFYLFLICWLMWITGGWLSWCVLRWRKPMLGLIPGAAAFATNLLNIRPGENDQNGYTLAILVLTLALLLWTNYTGSIASATRAHVKLTGDARWDFWESGLVAMAALIVLGIMLPPLSTADRTLDLESSLFSNWAQLQQRLSRPGLIGNGPAGGGTTGFTTEVPLGGPLARTKDPVFTYTLIGDTGPRYFRGVNVTLTAGGEWRWPSAPGFRASVGKNEVPPYTEPYQKLAVAGFKVRMLRPPIGYSDIVFYPGTLYRVDRETLATEVLLPPSSSTGRLTSIDRLSSIQPPTAVGTYTAYTEYSTATDAELRGAGTDYPDWLDQFAALPAQGYRSPDVQRRIHNLALDIVTRAGATNAYDQATAIQNYLRDSTNYKYTLTPTTAPSARDKLDYFLFSSKEGYCEFFASAMGDMLRSLGIPTRLVNGFGPGSFDGVTQTYIVRGEDAHTWVESYFPGYGWIPFEPTPDAGGYGPISRGTTGTNPCLRDENCDVPGGVVGGIGALPTPTGEPRGFRDPNDAANSQSGFKFRIPDAGTLTTIVGVLLALILVLFAAAARYLRPRTVMGVWKRMIALSELAGAKRPPGETPFELGRRLQERFPEASEPVDALTGGFVVAAYAPAEVAASARSSVMEAWTAVRPLLLRRVFARLRPNRS
jgi:transglutaminase-like putative cysteine protease